MKTLTADKVENAIRKLKNNQESRNYTELTVPQKWWSNGGGGRIVVALHKFINEI